MNELLTRRARIHEAMKALLEETAGRTMSGEEEAAWARLDEDMDTVQRSINIHDKGAEIASRLDTPAEIAISTRAVEQPHPATPEGRAGSGALRGAVVATPVAGGDFGRAHDYERAFDTYLRRGVDRLSDEQRDMLDREFRDLSIGTTTAGGYTVPPGFLQKITDALKAFGGMLQSANVITTDSGQPLQWPTADDTGNVGAILAENTGAPPQDITFGTKTLSSYMYTSKMIKVSFQLLADSAFDLNTWLPKKFAQRIGRAINNHFTNGTGGGTQPSGLVPGLSVGKTGAVGSTLTFGAGGATNPAYGELIDLIHSVDPAYRQNGHFMMADSSVKVARKILDAQGRPIWQPSINGGLSGLTQPDTLLGYPVIVNQDMPVMAVSAKSVAFGDFKEAYVIRETQGVQVLRLTERFADALQVGFLSFCRYDGVVDDANAAKLWVNSAT